ncbi:NAD(P)-dependent oxidoreductase [Paenibacillus aurantius]|uniref:NAD(P)-dependent oxidoreductase n=1 Tax=Paenibacillus aurantius TaxID=2918900 RepID=A0AA96LB32_9BACL|nr:NAD(P)-dependent oxidoreductase [Paenibacillus aurantius]WJH37246.1 NAD(P)-dependent oxidoreductase [Paenibacillus sp. CC-CFT747]WNQ10371.1 NAD(P)-dependent oxidoreductase [Paenibacillus aurantius]
MRTLEQLEQVMAKPSARLIEDMKNLEGDIMLLGVGGKMGPSLAKLIMNALKEAGVEKTVYGVSRFSEAGLKDELEAYGLKTIACDLLDEASLQALPEVKNVIYMAGTKFGTTGREYFTWAMNAYLPGRVAEKFKNSRIVVFSSGNVYPHSPVALGGTSEAVTPNPVGEYGQSCLGRERVFEYFSHRYETPVLIYRLNYAIDMRYGVLLELAKSVKEGKPIELAMGHFNCIWQGDANEIAIRSLLHCESPANKLNVTGPETISVRYAATELGKRLGIEPKFTGQEAETALLSNASKCMQLFGYPSVSLLQMIDWMAEWVEHEGVTINKPTHFQQREGKY